ncbi:MAG: ArsR/SmtB family transcription factor [Sphingomonadaceae bacterium]
MTRLHANRELAAAVAEKLKVYAQPQRLMILSCLLEGERNVAAIGEATGIGQPALSQQLAELRRAGLVSARREAREVWYALADGGVCSCVQTMEAVFGGTGTQAPGPLPPAPSTDRQPARGVAAFART